MYQVMLAADEPLILDTLKSIVDWKAKGFEIVGSYLDGSELLEALEYNHVDLIATDIKMSQVTGLEVAKYIHEKLSYCKVLVISGYLEFQLAVEAMQYGVTAYIAKPIDLFFRPFGYYSPPSLDNGHMHKSWFKESVLRSTLGSEQRIIGIQLYADFFHTRLISFALCRIIGGVICQETLFEKRITVI